MLTYLQNKISGSRQTLPVIAAYALVVWLACGVVSQGWWLQLACFAVSTYLMVLLNNMNALIRIYSRLVSCSFLMLYCCACFLFPSLRSALLTMAVAAAYVVLFMGYQDKQSVGTTYYAFLCIGLGSLAYVHVLYFVPVLWLLMVTCLLSFSWRTWAASLLGLLTPYWFGACWLLYQQDLSSAIGHFLPLWQFQHPFDYSAISFWAIITYSFIVVLAIMGSIHFLRKSYYDKIRTRMFFHVFIWMDLLTALFLAVQPQHYDAFLRLMIVNTSPLIAHFLALTSTKVTNAVFLAIVIGLGVLTACNVWNM